jgi:DNA-binding FrmR family transcriptional regulator
MAINRIAIAVAAALAAGVAPCFAQYPPVQPPAEEIAQARNCLCLEQAVAQARFELDVRNGIFEKARGDLDAIARAVEQRRPTVDVNDPTQVDAFRSLLARADAAREHYERVAVPEQQRAVAGYNGAVERLNAACQGRSFSTYAWEAARRDLVCPRN